MDANLILQVVLTLGAAAVIEIPVARYVTRRLVRRDVQAEVGKLSTALAEVKALLDGKTARVMPDPTAAVNARWEKARAREQTRADIFAWLTATFGPEQARVITAWLPKDIMESAVNAGSGDLARSFLEPIISAAGKHRKLGASSGGSNYATE